MAPFMKNKGTNTWRECAVALMHLGEPRKNVSLGGAWAENLYEE